MENTLTLNQPIIIKSLSLKFNLKIFIVAGFILMVLLLSFYTFQANDLVRGTYAIKQYEKQLSAVSQENNGLKISFLKSNSLDSVEILAANFNFEKINNAKYIQMINSQVAVNPVRN